MSLITFREALRAAMDEEMARDDAVILLGEEVGQYKGAYKVSQGLLEKYGPSRVIDTPISEEGFTGIGIGAAMAGLRPIVEVMTVNFSMLCLDQIVNNAATLRHMSGGQVSVPLVIRMATGAGRQLAAQHSHSLENWYAHVPGIKVLAPGTVQDARDMILLALEDPDPVFIFEHQGLYGMEGELDEGSAPGSPWRAAIRRPGATPRTSIRTGTSCARCSSSRSPHRVIRLFLSQEWDMTCSMRHRRMRTRVFRLLWIRPLRSLQLVRHLQAKPRHRK